MTQWPAASALLLGALCSSLLIVFDNGGFKQSLLGYVPWALMPYAVQAIAYIGLHLSRAHRRVQVLLTWATIVVALGGPLLYIDAMFIHVDAQGALAILMVPLIQTALSLFAVIVAVLWQWHISRSAAKTTRQPDDKDSPRGSALRGLRKLKRLIRTMLVSTIAIGALLYSLISMLQGSDSGAIEIAKEVDEFISRYCENNNSLPTSGLLKAQFPNLTTGSGWFFFTNDKMYLKMQYPMQWWNKNAIGEPKIFEFTATPYAYGVDYHCSKGK